MSSWLVFAYVILIFNLFNSQFFGVTRTDGKRKAGHIAGCNRQFRPGEAILARLISVATGRWTSWWFPLVEDVEGL